MMDKCIWKILAIFIVLVTIGSCTAMPSAWGISESEVKSSSATIYVPDGYSLTRVAVDNASFGDIIVAYNETYKENVTVLSTSTDSIQLVSVTPPAGTTLQRGTCVPFEVTVDYNLKSAATGRVCAELGLSTGRCVGLGCVDVKQGHGTAIIRHQIKVDGLYGWVQSDTVYLALSIGHDSFATIWKHMPDQYYFIASDDQLPLHLMKWSYKDYLPTSLDKILGILGRDTNVHGGFEAMLEPIDNVKKAEVELKLGYIPVKDMGSAYDPLDLGNPYIVWETKTYEMKRTDGSFIVEPEVTTWWPANLFANLYTLLMGPKDWLQSMGQSALFP
jgi:hypothetical protein